MPLSYYYILALHQLFDSTRLCKYFSLFIRLVLLLLPCTLAFCITLHHVKLSSALYFPCTILRLLDRLLLRPLDCLLNSSRAFLACLVPSQFLLRLLGSSSTVSHCHCLCIVWLLLLLSLCLSSLLVCVIHHNSLRIVAFIFSTSTCPSVL
ncbi:hypothetical protein BD769DRAFT_689969 [Suillus cothurnatus]|nr:hypothetical protein BD769DRAFT_689969 [Suillus cothurnatus]